jgi:hypothetical protein
LQQGGGSNAQAALMQGARGLRKRLRDSAQHSWVWNAFVSDIQSGPEVGCMCAGLSARKQRLSEAGPRRASLRVQGKAPDGSQVHSGASLQPAAAKLLSFGRFLFFTACLPAGLEASTQGRAV